MIDYVPKLVDLYDEDNPDGPDHDFYSALADNASAESILDLGCGTGILTVTFGGGGRRVVGVDRSATMLDYARRRVGADAVSWFLGDSRSIPASKFDLAVMNGNVAQHVPDDDWDQALLTRPSVRQCPPRKRFNAQSIAYGTMASASISTSSAGRSAC